MVQRKKLERRMIAKREAVLARVSERRERFRDEVREQICPSCGSHTISRLCYGEPSDDTEYQVDIDADLIFAPGRHYAPDDPVWICRNCVHAWGRRPASHICWTAHHSTGFSESLFGYDIRCEDGIADLDARWSWPKPSYEKFLVRFAIDDQPITSLVPALRAMKERYVPRIEDFGDWQLIVKMGGEVIRRNVAEGALFQTEIPELQPFVDFFGWLDNQVLDQLPFPVREL